jgi:DNA-3-methyladenine glycosylase II
MNDVIWENEEGLDMQANDSEHDIYRRAETHLSHEDAVMRRLIRHHGPCSLRASGESLFHHLASAVISQQLSVQAASTIQGRVMKLTSRPLRPQRFLDTDVEAVRAAGLSGSKVKYIRNIADAIIEGRISKRKLQHMDDQQVKYVLTSIKGIGSWTAEMVLMFGLNRLDIVSLGDAGLQRAARQLYNDGEADDDLLRHISESWKPYRTIACWYLWKAID